MDAPAVAPDADVTLAPLHDLLPLDLEEAAGVVASLASTIGDLHGVGLRAAEIDADAIVLRADGRPVLAHDPLPIVDVDDAVVTDVRALGRLLRSLLPESPASRLHARIESLLRRPTTSAAALAAVAERLMTATMHGPDAYGAADLIAGTVPSARLPGHVHTTVASSDGDGRGTRPYVIAVVVSAALFVGVLLFWPAHGRQSTAASPTQRSAPASSTPAPRGEGAAADPSCPSVHSALHADIDGDGCDEEVTFQDGVLMSAEGRFSIGEAGDKLATGRWLCHPPATLAVLRPSSGTVYVADRWPSTGAVTLRQVATLPGAIDLSAADNDNDGCDKIVVHHRDGSTTAVRAGGPAEPAP